MSDNAPLKSGPVPRSAAAPEGFRFVADYGLLVCLGEGGMGEVWAARDATSPKNRIIALKTTKQHGVEAAKVLYDEARIASLIEHPNVCRVHHLGKSGDVQYLVMDYCDGASLHDLLQAVPERRLPYDFSCRILASAAAGLHAAHVLEDEDGTPLGVVHRDVSPQNILISSKGLVTVTDFGVAKALGQAHKATETGEMKGKLSYMAPEQVTSKDVDARADVFALGCVLYQVTLGRRPFHGDDALSTLYQLLEEQLTLPSAVDPNIPPELEAVLVKSLSKDRDQRYQTAAELRRALEEVLLHLETRVADEDVARLMQQHLGPMLDGRKEEIRRRNEALSTFDRTAPPLTVPIPSTSHTSGASQIEESSKTLTSVRPPSKRSSIITASLVFLLVVVGGLIALKPQKTATGTPEDRITASPEPNAQPKPEEPKDATSPTTIAEGAVTLEVTATPGSAMISLDGKNLGQGNVVQEVARSSAEHVLAISAEGYESLTRPVVFNKSQSLTIALSPLAKKPVPSTSKPLPKPQTNPGTEPAPAPRKTPTKPPRKLDSDNPFATP